MRVAATSHDDLRRLAVWLARRREVDELMAVLTQYGPTAAERVAGHLDGLQVLLEAEADAFRRYRAAAPTVSQRPLPIVLPQDDVEPVKVHSMAAARVARRTP